MGWRARPRSRPGRVTDGNALMFGFLRGHEVVEFVKIEGRSLTFKCKRHYKVRAQPVVQVDIPIQQTSSSQRFKLPVTIKKVREVGRREYICTGEVPGTVADVEQLRQLLIGLDPTAVQPVGNNEDFANMRRAPRFKVSLRVLSKDLVGFRAISVDFNQHGLQIVAEGPIEVNQSIGMTLELETADTPEILCQAKVRWCSEEGRRRFAIGLEFEDLDPEVKKHLEKFEEFLVSRQTGDIAKRQVVDSRIFTDQEMGPGVDGEEVEAPAQADAAEAQSGT